MKKRAIVTLFLLAIFASVAHADSGRDFYKDKTLTIIIPSGVGGTHDAWARVIVPYLKNALSLRDVKIINRPGAGGLIGVNYTYGAKPDGLLIGEVLGSGPIIAQIQDKPGVNYDIKKYSWIAQVDDNPSFILVHPDGPFHTFADILALKGGDKRLQALATGPGGLEYNAQAIIYQTFGIPANLVTGFKGSHAAISAFVAQGQGDATAFSASNLKETGGDTMKPVLIIDGERSRLYPDVPTVTEVAKKRSLDDEKVSTLNALAEAMRLNTAFFAPPGVPEDRLAALRAAFREVTSSADFKKNASTRGLLPGYMSGDSIQHVVDDALNHAASFKRLVKK